MYVNIYSYSPCLLHFKLFEQTEHGKGHHLLLFSLWSVVIPHWDQKVVWTLSAWLTHCTSGDTDGLCWDVEFQREVKISGLHHELFPIYFIPQCFPCAFQYQCSLTSGPPLILTPLKTIGAELAVVFPLAEEKGTLKWHVCSSGSVEWVNQEDGATDTSCTSVPAGGNVGTKGKCRLKKS